MRIIAKRVAFICWVREGSQRKGRWSGLEADQVKVGGEGFLGSRNGTTNVLWIERPKFREVKCLRGHSAERGPD